VRDRPSVRHDDGVFDDALAQTVAAMSRVDVWWAVAGGWAIDLWLGEQTRDHHDVEVAVRRQDRSHVWDRLADTHELLRIDPPGSGWRPWNRADVVEPPAFQLQARAPRSTFDLFLENVGGGTWTFRRDLRIHRPLADVTTTVASGVRALRPEVQLLYMAKSDEPKHQLDFDAALPLLDSRARDWLATTLATTHPGPSLARAARALTTGLRLITGRGTPL
jgi:hypothetical protein